MLGGVSYNDMHGLGLLFRTEMRVDEMSMSFKPRAGLRSDKCDENRNTLSAYAVWLSKEYGNGELTDMTLLFNDWPWNTLEKWADGNNSAFIIKSETHIDPAPMQTIITVTVLGIHDAPWNEYQESFNEALVMHKLETNL